MSEFAGSLHEICSTKGHDPPTNCNGCCLGPCLNVDMLLERFSRKAVVLERSTLLHLEWVRALPYVHVLGCSHSWDFGPRHISIWLADACQKQHYCNGSFAFGVGKLCCSLFRGNVFNLMLTRMNQCCLNFDSVIFYALTLSVISILNCLMLAELNTTQISL